MKITDKYVNPTYDLNVGEGDERELMEQATAERPLEFIFGTNSMLEVLKSRSRDSLRAIVHSGLP